MRLEIIIPDNTRSDLIAKLTGLTQRLSAFPELVDEIELSEDTDDASIQRLFTPKLLAEIEAADTEIDAGMFFTTEQVEEHFKQKSAEWANQHRR
jgi:hypothetical protein